MNETEEQTQMLRTWENMRFYAKFIGTWDARGFYWSEEGEKVLTQAVWSTRWNKNEFSAWDSIQMPQWKNRDSMSYQVTNMNYNPKEGCWHSLWFGEDGEANPCTAYIQNGEMDCRYAKGGVLRRWIFTQVEQNHLRWRLFRSGDNGQTWKDSGDFQVTRRQTE